MHFWLSGSANYLKETFSIFLRKRQKINISISSLYQSTNILLANKISSSRLMWEARKFHLRHQTNQTSKSKNIDFIFWTTLNPSTTRWMKAIESSVATCRELSKSRFRRFKNISLILDTFDEHVNFVWISFVNWLNQQGLEELEDKIRNDLEKIRVLTVGDDEVITESNIDSLLQLQKANAEEYLSVTYSNKYICN